MLGTSGCAGLEERPSVFVTASLSPVNKMLPGSEGLVNAGPWGPVLFSEAPPVGDGEENGDTPISPPSPPSPPRPHGCLKPCCSGSPHRVAGTVGLSCSTVSLASEVFCWDSAPDVLKGFALPGRCSGLAPLSPADIGPLAGTCSVFCLVEGDSLVGPKCVYVNWGR